MENRLRELRTEKGLSQTELAALLCMSQSGYSKYERGENIPNTILIKLAAFYEVSIDYLLGVID